MGRRVVVAALLAVFVGAGPSSADNNPQGVAFRFVGWFRGPGEFKEGEIKCEIPTIKNAISDGSFAMGLWNTFGVPNFYFPDINNAFSDPCGGYMQLQNNLLDQAIALDRIVLQYKIPGARRFRQFVPTRNGFPIACPRKSVIFAGGVMNPINSTQDSSQSGAPNVMFMQILPMVSTQLFTCLRSQYGPLPTDLYSSLPLVIRATAYGLSDVGDRYRTNTIGFTLNLRHTCGNGRLDDGEICDPNAPNPCPFGFCIGGICSLDLSRACATDSDCAGTCTTGNIPEECICLFN